MKLYELLAEEERILEEAFGQNLKRAAALAAALTFAPVSADASPKPVPITQQQPQKPQQQQLKKQQPPPQQAARQINQEVNPISIRKAQFTKTLLPYVNTVNAGILQDRGKLLQLLKKKQLSEREQDWVDSKIREYKAKDIKDLLSHIDIVPPSMALAQAALESGWGTSDIAREHNAFYGQKAWGNIDSVEAPGGEKYHTFSSPLESVKSYINNINTHPAYEGLRKIRAQLKDSKKSQSGLDIAVGLEKYSTRGQAYVKDVQKMIKANFLNLTG